MGANRGKSPQTSQVATGRSSPPARTVAMTMPPCPYCWLAAGCKVYVLYFCRSQPGSSGLPEPDFSSILFSERNSNPIFL
jgi:hypothetical protein